MSLRALIPITTAVSLLAPASASADFIHTVMPGESLSSIAAADGLNVAQLAAANGLPTDAQLVVGAAVTIPPQSGGPLPAASPTDAGTAGPPGDNDDDGDDSASPTVTPAATPSVSVTRGDGDADGDDSGASSSEVTSASSGASSGTSYVVQPGDTLTAIASRAGVSLSSLAAANGLDPNGVLPAGKVLVLSGSPAGLSSQASATASAAGYVVQPGDTLTAIATRTGVSISALAAANGLDPNGVLPAGTTLQLSGSATSAVPSQAPAVGTTITGRMTWFGGPDDPNAQGAPASGLGYLSNGMAYYNSGSLGRNWLIHFPWGQSMNMRQIDIGPGPWTGNPFDLAYSALPNTPYNEQTWPNPTVTGTYLGP